MKTIFKRIFLFIALFSFFTYEAVGYFNTEDIVRILSNHRKSIIIGTSVATATILTTAILVKSIKNKNNRNAIKEALQKTGLLERGKAVYGKDFVNFVYEIIKYNHPKRFKKKESLATVLGEVEIHNIKRFIACLSKLKDCNWVDDKASVDLIEACKNLKLPQKLKTELFKKVFEEKTKVLKGLLPPELFYYGAQKWTPDDLFNLMVDYIDILYSPNYSKESKIVQYHCLCCSIDDSNAPNLLFQSISNTNKTLQLFYKNFLKDQIRLITVEAIGVDPTLSLLKNP